MPTAANRSVFEGGPAVSRPAGKLDPTPGALVLERPRELCDGHKMMGIIRHETAPGVTGRGRLVSAVSCLLLRDCCVAKCAPAGPTNQGRPAYTIVSVLPELPENSPKRRLGAGQQYGARQVPVAYVRWWMPLSPDTFWACRAQRRQLDRCARMPCKYTPYVKRR